MSLGMAFGNPFNPFMAVIATKIAVGTELYPLAFCLWLQEHFDELVREALDKEEDVCGLWEDRKAHRRGMGQ